MTVVVVPSVLQQAGVVDRGRATRAEDGHDDRQADDASASHSVRWTIFRTRRSASVDDASLLKY